jgi:hypothetical protein
MSQALGLRLRIGDAGSISVERPAPKKPAAKPAAARPPQQKSTPRPKREATTGSGGSDKSATQESTDRTGTGTTARDYPSTSPSGLRQLTDALKPAVQALPRPVRRRVRRAYRRLTK